MLNDRTYNNILSQFQITDIFQHITAKHIRSDISEVISFCAAALVCIENGTPHEQCTLNGT